MNFEWTKEVHINWRNGFIKEEDVGRSVIQRLLNNTYCAPLSERVPIQQTPFWSPQDAFGTTCNERNQMNHKFIPGQLQVPSYPQVSELTRQQHLQAMKVVCVKHKNVQPKFYMKPNAHDYKVFEEIKELYEAEQKKFLEWAKYLWINGGCIRALRPKPIIEQVYEAEFKMRAHNVRSWPQNYKMVAQIPLETNKDSFEINHKEDLLNVNVEDLPITDYPEVMVNNLSILLKSCPMPEPCREHICKFVLPYEDSVSSLPMSEIHRELAHFAISHDSSFVASENALQCLLETDRSWHLPVTVIETIHPEHGDRRTVIVLGSEFGVQKECATQRTYRAYKHLLHHAFVPSMGQYNLKASNKQPTSLNKSIENVPNTKEPVAQRMNRFVSLDDELEASSDEDEANKLLIDDIEPESESKKVVDDYEPNKISNDKELNGEHKHLESCEPNKRINESIDSDPEVNELLDDPHELDYDEPSSDTDQLIIADSINPNAEPNYDTYEPNYTHDWFEERPSYSNTEPSDDDTQQAKLSICKNFYSRMASEDGNRDASNMLEIQKPSVLLKTSKYTESIPEEVNQNNSKAKQSNVDNLSNNAIKNNKINLLKDVCSRMAEEASKSLDHLKFNESKILKPKEIQKSLRIDKTNNFKDNFLEANRKEGSLESFESNVKLLYKPSTINSSNKQIKHTDKKMYTKTNETLLCTDNTKDDSEPNKQSKVTPKILSPIKPCSVSLGSLSISESKSYNLTGLSNVLNIVSPNKNKTSSKRNDKTINDSIEDQLSSRKNDNVRVKPIASMKDPKDKAGNVSCNTSSKEIIGNDNISDLEKLKNLDTGPSATKMPRLMVDDSQTEPQTTINNLSRVKNNPVKVNLCELFGDESDSDEPINTLINAKREDITQATHNLEVLNCADILNSNKINTDGKKLNINNPMCTLKNLKSPVNKRKLSCSDPLSDSSEINTSISGSENEEAISGFQNGLAIPTPSSQKKSQKPPKVTRTYSLRSRKSHTKISKLSHTNKNKSSIIETDSRVTRSRKISYTSNISDDSKNVIKDIKTDNVPLRRSRRFSTRLNSEEHEDLLKDKTVAQEKPEGLRRSRRLSERSNASDIQPKINITINKTPKVNPPRRSNSRVLNKDLTLDISDRSKRALRRTLNVSSDTDYHKPNKTKHEKTNSTSSRNNSITESDSDSVENETELKIFHFTIDESDSEESDTETFLTIDDSQSQNAITEENEDLKTKDDSDIISDTAKFKTPSTVGNTNATKLITPTNALQASKPLQTNSNSTVENTSYTSIITMKKTDISPTVKGTCSDKNVTSINEIYKSKMTRIESTADTSIITMKKTDISPTVKGTCSDKNVTSINEIYKSKMTRIESTADTSIITMKKTDISSTVKGTCSDKNVTSINEIYKSKMTRIESTADNINATQSKVKTKEILQKTNANEQRNGKSIFDDKIIRNEISNSKDGTLAQKTIHDIIGVNRCTCKDTLFAVPPPRSFKKWQLRNNTSNVAYDVIVHSSHKARLGKKEVILEPIVEFQPELGATRQSAGKTRTLALALMMRDSPTLVNVRVNHENGNVIVIDSITQDQFVERHGDLTRDISDRLHTALDQLRFLMPGQYILAHEPSHGPNAMLFAAGAGAGAHSLQLRRANINMPDVEDALHVKTAPDLAPIPLPFHKHRGILPLAFSPNQNHVSTNKKITAVFSKRAKLPPHGIQWPKKKKKKARKPRQDRQPQANSTHSLD